MPKELIFGDVYTVKRGDLPIMQARTRDDLVQIPTAAPTTTPTPDDELQLQATLELRWDRDGHQIGLYISAHNHDTGLPVDVGGWWINLDWQQTNRLIAKIRTGRNQTWGAPE